MRAAIKNAVMLAIMATAWRVSSEPHYPAFEVSGSLDHIVFRSDSFTNQSSQFKMAVSGNQWRINFFKNERFCSETTCDGTNIYHFNPTNILSFDARFYDIPPQCYWVSVESGLIPSGGYPVEIPWLAYASSPAVQASLVNLPAPWLNPRYHPRAHAYKAEVNIFTNPPYLPERVDFTLSKTQADKACASPWLNIEDFKINQHWKPNEPDGFMGASYKVFAVTNIHGLILPTSFELVTYRPALKRRVTGIYRGTNIVIKEITFGKIAPTVPDKPMCVRDFRFQNREQLISHIDYVADNWISSVKSDDLKEIFRQKTTDRNLPLVYLAKARENPVMLYVVFVLALLSPLPVFLFMAIRKRRA